MTLLDTWRLHWALFRARLAYRCMRYYGDMALALAAEAASYLSKETKQ